MPNVPRQQFRYKSPRLLGGRTKNHLQKSRTGSDRILANFLFFFSDHQIKTIKRSLRNIGVKVGIFRIDQTKLGSLASILIVFVGELHSGRSLLNDGQKFCANRPCGGALEILRCRIITTHENRLGVVKTHLPDRVNQNRLGLDDGQFRRMVECFDQFIGLLAHAKFTHHALSLLQGIRQGYPDARIAKKTIAFAELANRRFSTFDQRLLESGRRVLVRQIGNVYGQNLRADGKTAYNSENSGNKTHDENPHRLGCRTQKAPKLILCINIPATDATLTPLTGMKKSRLPQWLKRALVFSAAHRYYPLLVTLICFASTVTFSFPFAAVLIPAILLAPKRWLSIGLLCGVASGCGAAVLVEIFRYVGSEFVLARYPELLQLEGWQWASEWLQRYGLVVMLIIAASPMPQTPALFFCALASLPTLGILIAVGIGKTIKYLFLAWATARYPARFIRYT